LYNREFQSQQINKKENTNHTNGHGTRCAKEHYTSLQKSPSKQQQKEMLVDAQTNDLFF
jgi:hypothetical protein